MSMGVGAVQGGGAVEGPSWGKPAPKGGLSATHKQAKAKLPKSLKARPPRRP